MLVALAWAMTFTPIAYGADRGMGGTGGTKSPAEQFNQRIKTMKIRLRVDGKVLDATLSDNATSRDFYSLLPMTLTLDDYASTEKISYLPKKLSKEGAPAGCDPAVGDITYYAPWGNLAIFYRDFGYASGLIKLGQIDSGLAALKVSGSVPVTIEPVENELPEGDMP